MTRAALVPHPVPLAAVPPARRLRQLLAHLGRRELQATHRSAVLGVAWPALRLGAQWAVLAFVFTSLADLGIPDYGAFLATGLVAWAGFSAGVAAGTRAIVDRRHLVLQPGVPSIVLPPVAALVALGEALVALPVVLVVLGVMGKLAWTVALLPAVIALQILLMWGLAWLTASIAVFIRDVPAVVDVGLTLLFYLTPVFYASDRVPEELRPVIDANPAGALVQAWRGTLLDGDPSLAHIAVLAGWAAAAAVAGLLVFRRLARGLVDEL